MGRLLALGLALSLLVAAVPAKAQDNLSPDARADRMVREMTLDEKIQLVHTKVGKRDPNNPPPQGPNDDVGYVAPIPRLGIPPLHIDDGSLGVANAWNARDGDEATALPSGLALASTWNPHLAFEAWRDGGGRGAAQGVQRASRWQRQSGARSARWPRL